jgi:hypothetical protein
MNKFKPLFDIRLAQYDTLDEYPPAEEIKRVLEAHLVNHSDIPPKKPDSRKDSAVTIYCFDQYQRRCQEQEAKT